MTYSVIVLEGDVMVIGVVSGSVAVGSRVPWAKPCVGGVVTQGYTNPALGPLILSFLERGYSARRALEEALRLDPMPELRQVAVMSWDKDKAYHCGSLLPREVGVATSESAVAVGNLLSSSKIPEALIETLEEHRCMPLPLRVLEALKAGHELGGDARGDRTACLLVAYSESKKTLKIDVDESPDPLAELEKQVKKALGKL